MLITEYLYEYLSCMDHFGISTSWKYDIIVSQRSGVEVHDFTQLEI